MVNLKQNRTVLAQPKGDDQVFSYEGEEALLLLQQTSLLEQPAQQQELSYQRTSFVSQQEDCLVEVKSRIDGEKEKQLLCREWIGDEETSDYSSQSSSKKGEVFPFGLTLEEKALLKLEKVIAPLELEAAEAITAVKMGEGISRLEEVGQLLNSAMSHLAYVGVIGGREGQCNRSILPGDGLPAWPYFWRAHSGPCAEQGYVSV